MHDSGNLPEKRRRRRPEPTPVQRALGLLVRREHSRKELARKLIARGITPEDAAAAVTRVAAEGWQDDARFAASLARARVSGGYGPLRIQAELGTHGLGEEVIAQAFAVLAEAGDDDWPGRALELVHRRFGADFANDLALRRKAADFLLRRGFDGDTIRGATRSLRP
jgi:regulatory protein